MSIHKVNCTRQCHCTKRWNGRKGNIGGSRIEIMQTALAAFCLNHNEILRHKRATPQLAHPRGNSVKEAENLPVLRNRNPVKRISGLHGTAIGDRRDIADNVSCLGDDDLAINQSRDTTHGAMGQNRVVVLTVESEDFIHLIDQPGLSYGNTGDARIGRVWGVKQFHKTALQPIGTVRHDLTAYR